MRGVDDTRTADGNDAEVSTTPLGGRATRRTVPVAGIVVSLVALNGCGGGSNSVADDASPPAAPPSGSTDGVLAAVQNRSDDEGFDLWGCTDALSDGPPVFHHYQFVGDAGRRAPPDPNADALEFTVTESGPGTLLLDYAAVGEQEELSDFRFDAEDGFTVTSSSLGALTCALATGTVFDGSEAERELLVRLSNAVDAESMPRDVWHCGDDDDGSRFTLFVSGSVGRYDIFHTRRVDFADVILLDPDGPDAVVLSFPENPGRVDETLSAIAFDGPDAFVAASTLLETIVTCRRTPAGVP